MSFRVNSVADYDNQLVPQVLSGTLHVITAIDYNKLPASLKRRYYPQFRRADTPYRLYSQYMRARQDIDPNTVVPTMVQPRKVVLSPQMNKEPKDSEVQKSLNINADVTRTGTDLSKKTFREVVSERNYLMKNKTGVTTVFSRY